LHTILSASLVPPRAVEEPPAFAASRDCFERILRRLAAPEAGELTHGDLESLLDSEGRKLLRQLVQDHLDLRALREVRREDVVDADQVARTRTERGHRRALTTIFGEVTVERLAYRAPGVANLYPADAVLNLPAEKHSHGLRQLAAIESPGGSFDEAAAAIVRATGVRVGKRQVEGLAAAAAVDVLSFYETAKPGPSPDSDPLVLSVDGKGVVMRPESLRESTRRAAASSGHKLATRLSAGEKRNRKRMAEVGAVYDCDPVPRTPDDIIPIPSAQGEGRSRPKLGPTTRGKWLTASVVESIEGVISMVFDEATRRDSQHRRPWVVLVDGNRQQIDAVLAEARRRQVDVTVVIDFVHVLEYVWKAAWCFFDQGDRNAEDWVAVQARRILAGHSQQVAAAIRAKATRSRLLPDERKAVDVAANYLTNKRTYLNYPRALARGWPIATGVIEGACRHLVKDRMDLTGARWSLDGAEAVLRLRALVSNGDFDAYWRYHLAQEQQRVHQARYATVRPTPNQLALAA
jgi:hypothetical protein